MRVPNVAERMKVAERVKEAPAHALRAVFAGVGQALLLSDRVRRRFRDGGQETAPAARPATGRPAAAGPSASSAAGAPAAPATQPATKPAPAPAPGPAPTAGPASAAAPEPSAPAPAATPAPSTAAAGASTASREAEAGTASAPEPPFPNYDELSIASLRARMRGLDISQLRDVIKYEKAHAARADVIAMFERRIGKIENTP